MWNPGALSALQEGAGEDNYLSELRAAGRGAGSLCQVAGREPSLSLPLLLCGESTCHRPAASEGDTKARFGSGEKIETRGDPRRLRAEDEPFLAAQTGTTASGSTPGTGLRTARFLPTRAPCGRGAQSHPHRQQRARGAGGGQGLAQGHSDSTQLTHAHIGLLPRQGGL